MADNVTVYEHQVHMIPKIIEDGYEYLLPKDYFDALRGFVYTTFNRSKGGDEDNCVRDFSITPIYKGLKLHDNPNYYQTTKEGFCFNVRSVNPLEIVDRSTWFFVENTHGKKFYYKRAKHREVDIYTDSDNWRITKGLCLMNPKTLTYLDETDINSPEMIGNTNRILREKCETYNLPNDEFIFEFVRGQRARISSRIITHRGEEMTAVRGQIEILKASPDMKKIAYALGLGKLTNLGLGSLIN